MQRRFQIYITAVQYTRTVLLYPIIIPNWRQITSQIIPTYVLVVNVAENSVFASDQMFQSIDCLARLRHPGANIEVVPRVCAPGTKSGSECPLQKNVRIFTYTLH